MRWASACNEAIASIAFLLLPAALSAQQPVRENVFYLVDAKDAYESFARNARRVDIIAPQSFKLNADGSLRGAVDPGVIEVARKNGVRIMPLIVNPDWESDVLHNVMIAGDARVRFIDYLVSEAKRQGFWGWQFDFENIPITDQDLLTNLVRDAALELHARGYTLSIAVMPDPGYLDNNWAWQHSVGVFDVKALAAAVDFISVMTYDQHHAQTPPGPSAGIPWMEKTVQHMLDRGVPADKLSLGVPFFSMRWFSVLDSVGKYATAVRSAGYAAAHALMEEHHASVFWDPIQQTTFATWETAGALEHLYLEDARSLNAKHDLANKYRLRGVSIWRIGLEDPAVWSRFNAR